MSTPLDTNEWVKRLSVPGTTLLEPFTADSTRSEGKQLILISVVTILLSMDLLKITEGSVGVFKIALVDYLNVVLLAAVTCVYFLLVYSLYLYRDWKASYYKRLPAVVEQHRLREELTRAENERIRRHNHLQSEIAKLLSIRQGKLAAMKEAGEERTARPAEASPDELEDFFEDEMAAFRSRQQESEAYEAHCSGDGLDELQKENLKLAFDGTLSARADALLSILQTTNRMDKYRFIADVIFPCSICGIAILMSIARLYS